MNNIDNLFKEIRNQNVEKPLLNKGEINNLVNKKLIGGSYADRLLPQWVSYSAAAALVLLAIGSVLFFLNNKNYETKVDEMVHSGQNLIENQDFIVNESKIENKIEAENSFTINTNNEVKKVRKIVRQISVSKNEFDDNSNNDAIEGLKMIVLNNEELKALNIYVDKNTVNFGVEEVISNNNFNNNPNLKQKLIDLNYPVDNNQVLAHSNIFYSVNPQNVAKCDYHFVEFDGKDEKNHTCISPVKFEIIGSANNKNMRIFDDSPVFNYAESIPSENSDEEIYKTIYDDFNHEKSIANTKLVPIFIKTDAGNGNGIVLWYVPTDDFVNNLPSRYKENIKAEINLIKQLENKKLSIDHVCDALAGNQTYFNICQQKTGSIEKMTLYPNPAFGATICKYKLNERKSVKISIHDINGKFIKEFQKECLQEPGIYEFKLDLINLNSGNYLVAISTDDCNQIIERLIIK